MSEAAPRVTAVIVTYESSDTIDAALRALRLGYEAGMLEAIVVDNASSDGTPEQVARNHPWATLVHSGGNLGYGRGCNLGFERANTPYLLVMNPDAVVEVEALDTLVRFMDAHEKAGLCGPAVVEGSGRLQLSGAMLTPVSIMLKPILPRLAGPRMRSVEPGESPMRTNWICGSIMLIRRPMIDELRGFDPRFFLYFEETDLCKRAAEADWEIWTVGEATCRHVAGASAGVTGESLVQGAIAKHFFESRFYYLVKHHGRVPAVAAELGELCAMSLRALIERLRGRPYPNLGLRWRAPILKQPAQPEDRGRCVD
ncbi:glycosyltransferase family 2 protein [Thioalkalivibrio sp. XN279]|uniref:glycosyltransferase family 2 protein n=1 Tax=Thioalkalivibrio sp. XN279 TaxID=2714953 RepID=UPI00140745EE|nr:glycosyltransferase family 2 protein [Thioalkalivibrio sp. XN279]NHA15374.1 glycosyltransferase family 2 protein [Thioalkalivibrio sp. XN279]